MRHLILLAVMAQPSCATLAFGQQQGEPDFVTQTYAERARALDSEPELAAAIADLLEAARRRDPSLVEPWLERSTDERTESQTDYAATVEHDAAQIAEDDEDGEGYLAEDDLLREIASWDGEIWDRFARSLAVGVSVNGDTADALSVITLDGVAVGADSAFVHVAPDRSSPILATVGRAIVQEDYDHRPDDPRVDGWVAVKSDDGRRGYLATESVEELLYMGIVFMRSPQGWRLAYFATGC